MIPAENDLESDSGQLASPRVLFIVFLALIGLGVAGAQASWGTAHAVLFTVAGVLMMIFPPVTALPRSWWILAGVFGLCLGGAFLPDAWFPALVWRSGLGGLGLDTGTQVTAHPQAAAEMAMALGATLMVGLWIAGHRPSSRGVRLSALCFTLGVAGGALLVMTFPSLLRESREPTFGFFPNRNHNATLLAMGALVGLGCLTQAIREKRAGSIMAAAIATMICLWAILGWSVSRAGVILVVVGTLGWVVLLGPRYFGSHARRALLLLAVAAAGGFLIAESVVKERLAETFHRAQPGNHNASIQDIDFRIPTWMDTLTMIRDRPWTGFGPGQFVFIFPQYRQRTVEAHGTKHFHPESDWLWLAAESGIPAAVALASLVAAAAFASIRGLSRGKARAVRAGCLVAALVLLVHSLADVPGHRVPLAWSAALLLGLSLRILPGRQHHAAPWLFRIAGLAVVASGLALAYAEKFTATGPAMTRADRAVEESLAASRPEVNSRIKFAPRPGASAESRRLISEAMAILPMDPRLHFLNGALAIDLPSDTSPTPQAFAIERALNPTALKTPIRQASVWAPWSSRHAAELCAIARAQAAALDQHGNPPPDGFPTWSAAVEAQISPLVKRYPKLAPRLGLPVPASRR
jgi:O-antigen ligase